MIDQQPIDYRDSKQGILRRKDQRLARIGISRNKDRRIKPLVPGMERVGEDWRELLGVSCNLLRAVSTKGLSDKKIMKER